jgi:hypothetical protein
MSQLDWAIAAAKQRKKSSPFHKMQVLGNKNQVIKEHARPSKVHVSKGEHKKYSYAKRYSV